MSLLLDPLHVGLVCESVRANLTTDSNSLVNFSVVVVNILLVAPGVVTIRPWALGPLFPWCVTSFHVNLQLRVGRGFKRTF